MSDAEYKRLLAAATGKIRTLIQLMRWSGLAIRDASTLKRADLHFANVANKVIRERTKTGTPLYIPIPADVAAEVQLIKPRPTGPPKTACSRPTLPRQEM